MEVTHYRQEEIREEYHGKEELIVFNDENGLAYIGLNGSRGLEEDLQYSSKASIFGGVNHEKCLEDEELFYGSRDKFESMNTRLISKLLIDNRE